jgi:hypothetical protein
MRLYTILKGIIQTLRTIVSTKQNKTWTKIGSGQGTVRYSLTKYTDLSVYVTFGGVRVGQLIPTSIVPSSGSITLFVGYYNNVIYVTLSKTQAAIASQPAGYTGNLEIYAR